MVANQAENWTEVLRDVLHMYIAYLKAIEINVGETRLIVDCPRGDMSFAFGGLKACICLKGMMVKNTFHF